MRILVAGPPKAGNVWVESILADIYGLKIIDDDPVPATPRQLRSAIEAGWFPEGAIFHQHFSPSAELFEVVEDALAAIVTPIRSPYDMFVSLYHYAQKFSDGFVAVNDPAQILIGKPIDHPDVLEFLRSGFPAYIDLGVDWLRSGRSQVVRYEALHADPNNEIRRLTDHLLPVTDDRIHAAIEHCTADSMRQRSHWLQKHIRSGRANDWQQYLTRDHLRIMQEASGQRIEALGYPVVRSRADG